MIGGARFPFRMARRMRRYRITDHGLALLLEKGNVWGVREGIPEGATACGLGFEKDLNCVVLFVEHPSFEYVEDGYIVPEGPITFADVRAELKEWKESL
jgi:hypothetical protein